MKLQCKHKKYLLFFIFIVGFIGILFSPNVSAQEPVSDAGRVIRNHINASLKLADEDDQLNSNWKYDSNYVRHTTTVTEISPLYSAHITFSPKGGTSYLAETYLTVTLQSDIWTRYIDEDDIFYDITSKTENFKWLTVALEPTWKSWGFNPDLYPYWISYTDYDMSPSIAGGNDYCKADGIDAVMQLDFDITPFAVQRAESVENETLVEFVSLLNPKYGEIINSKTTDVAVYHDEFNTLQQTSVTFGEFSRFDEDKPLTRVEAWDEVNDAETEEEVQAYASPYGVWARVPTQPPEQFNTHPYGQIGASSVAEGNIGNNFKFEVINRPDVSIYTQDVCRREGYIGIDTQGLGKGVRDYHEVLVDDDTREVGWHIYQKNIRLTFEVEMQLTAEILCDDTEFLREIIALPDFQVADRFWDMAMTGAIDSTILTSQGWGDYVWTNYKSQIIIIIVIVVIIGTIVLFIWVSGKLPNGKSGGKGRDAWAVSIFGDAIATDTEIGTPAQQPKRGFLGGIFNRQERMANLMNKPPPKTWAERRALRDELKIWKAKKKVTGNLRRAEKLKLKQTKTNARVSKKQTKNSMYT